MPLHTGTYQQSCCRTAQLPFASASQCPPPRPYISHTHMLHCSHDHPYLTAVPLYRRTLRTIQVRANHVFLLEPSLDPAIEKQAVARVHRIGQTRDVTVTRLLDGTMEGAVMRMLKVCTARLVCVKARVFWGSGGQPSFLPPACLCSAAPCVA